MEAIINERMSGQALDLFKVGLVTLSILYNLGPMLGRSEIVQDFFAIAAMGFI